MTTAKDVSFADVCPLFLTSYEKYQRYLQQVTINPHEPCFMTFGTPGVGKSAFIARLKSLATPAEFCQFLHGRRELVKEVDGITIGHQVASTCTLFPQMHLPHFATGFMQVCDMPGFNDPDQKKRMVISVLQKCFLTQVGVAQTRTRFLVVVDARMLTVDDKFTDIISKYFNSLKDLFADQFETCSQSLYFIVTKYDLVKHEYDRRGILQRVREAKRGAGDRGEELLNIFFMRFIKHHVIVDYAEDDREEISRLVRDMITADDRSNQSAVEMTLLRERFHITHDALNDRCVAEVAALQGGLSKNLAEALAKAKGVEDGFEGVFGKIKKDIKAGEASHADASAQLARFMEVQQRVNECPAKVSDADRKKTIAQEGAAVAESLLTLFPTAHSTERVITMRKFVSDNDKKVDIVLGIPQNADVAVLVCPYEKNDDTLKKRWAPDGAPPTINDVNKVAEAPFWYSSGGYRHPAGLAEAPQVKHNPTDVSISCVGAQSTMYSVYVFVSSEAKTAPEIKLAWQFYEKLLAQKQSDAKAASEELAKLQKQNEQDLLFLRQNDSLVKAAGSSVERARVQLGECCERTLPQLREDAAAKIRGFKTLIAAIAESQSLAKLKEVLFIFNANGLQTSLSDSLAELESQIESANAAVEQRVDAVDALIGKMKAELLQTLQRLELH